VSTATVEGIRLYYEMHGNSAEPLVLVHGYTGDTTDWRHQLTEFTRTHCVLVLDLRGHGRSEAPKDRSSYTVRQMSADVEALIEQAGFQRYHLVGHSMGGAIVQEIALRSPQRLASLTLHDTSIKFAGAGNQEMLEWQRKRFELAETEGMAAVAEMPPTMAPPPHMPPERLDETKQRLSRLSPDAFLGAWNGLMEWPGMEERAAAIATPTLIVYGSLDAPGIIEGSQSLAQKIPNARVEIIPEAAHSPQWERPELFNRALRQHLEDHAFRE
jgi:3-oxoadipate enol-lactonase